MNKNKLKIIFRIILLGLIILICVKIYEFSAQTGEESSSLSEDISRVIIRLFPEYRDLNEK